MSLSRTVAVQVDGETRDKRYDMVLISRDDMHVIKAEKRSRDGTRLEF